MNLKCKVEKNTEKSHVSIFIEEKLKYKCVYSDNFSFKIYEGYDVALESRDVCFQNIIVGIKYNYNLYMGEEFFGNISSRFGGYGGFCCKFLDQEVFRSPFKNSLEKIGLKLPSLSWLNKSYYIEADDNFLMESFLIVIHMHFLFLLGG